MIPPAGCMVLRSLIPSVPYPGTAFVGREHLETAPPHDAWPAHQHGGSVEPRHVRGTRPSAAQPAALMRKAGGKRNEDRRQEGCTQDVRSPPRLQPSASEPSAVPPAATFAATTTAAAENDHGRFVASSPGSGKQDQNQNQAKGDDTQAKERAALGEDDGQRTPNLRTCEGQPTVPGTDVREASGGFRDQDSAEAVSKVAQDAPGATASGGAETELTRARGSGGLTGVPHNVAHRATNVAPSSSDATATRHHSQRGGARAAPDSAVRDNWGSVFVVGGGRRRRRPPVMHTFVSLKSTTVLSLPLLLLLL